MFNRPDHPDFWRISEIIIDCDDAAEKEGLDAALDGHVDKESLAYMANQRAYRALNIQTQQDLEDPATKHSIGIIAAIWMDAFVVGAKFESKKEKREDTGIGSPHDPRL